MTLRYFHVKKSAKQRGIDVTETQLKALEAMVDRGVDKAQLGTLVDALDAARNREHETRLALGRPRCTPSKLGHEQ